MKLILVFAVVLLLSSCGKYESGGDVYVYIGHVLKIADSTPYANTSFVLVDQRHFSPVAGKGDIQQVPITTDENGYFLVTLKRIRAGELGLCWPDDSKFVDHCPVQYIQETKIADVTYDCGYMYMK